MPIPLQRVTSLFRRVQDNAPVAGAETMDKSVVQGVQWAKFAMDHCLVCRVKVSEVCPLSFDGSHAMLIRNHDGDFAVCTVSWHDSSTLAGNSHASIVL